MNTDSLSRFYNAVVVKSWLGRLVELGDSEVRPFSVIAALR